MKVVRQETSVWSKEEWASSRKDEKQLENTQTMKEKVLDNAKVFKNSRGKGKSHKEFGETSWFITARG